MISKLLSDVLAIYIAYGATDFRKQINSLCVDVKSRFRFDPYKNCSIHIL